MSDPKRLCEAGTPLEARLLASALGDAPRKGLGRRVQVALGVGGLAIGTGTASTTAAAASKAAPFLASLGVAKWAGILVLGAGTVVGAAVIHRPKAVSPPPSVSVSVAAPRTEARPAQAVDVPAPPPERAEPPPAPALPEPRAAAPAINPPPSTAQSPATRKPAAPELAGELALLDGAHAALDSGDTQRALTLLDRHDLEFPSGNLAPEALALRVEAYALRHDDVKVTELGRSFLAQYPAHPQARRVQASMKR